MNNFKTTVQRTCSLFFLLCYCHLSSAQPTGVDWSVEAKPNLDDEKVERQVEKLLSGMTLKQKVAQMIQPEIGYLTVDEMRKYGFGSYLNGGNSAPYGIKQADAQTWLKYADEMYSASVDATLDGSTIPTIWGTDAMHGHSNVFGATLFPHNIGLGAARDPDLIEKIGIATAKEVAATGIEWSFAPTVAVVRDDRWGRTYESYSEDPEIVADYADRMVMGIQGHPEEDFLKGFHRIATAKHFIGDGGTQGGIDRGDTRLDEKTLRDIHAAGYVSALQAGVQSVMASFNSWNGKRVHGDKYLLTEVLKGKMGFDGFIVSDWNAHKFVDGCDLEQCAAAINAGVDVLMVPEHYEAFFHNTVKQVQDGIIPISRIDDAVRRFLRAKIRWGVLSRGKPTQRLGAEHPQWLNATEHKTLAREAVRKSLVLLKNNGNTLPLAADSHILVAGEGADNIAMQAGGWSVSWQGTDNTNADFPNATSVYAAIKHCVESAGGTVQYSESGMFKQKPDAAVVVLGEQPYAEWFGDIKTLRFEDNNNKSLKVLEKLKSEGVPVVTVFLSGRPLWINPILNKSDAFVAAWLPGSEGQGVTDVILSKPEGGINYDFTGRLSFSWPKFDDQYLLNRNDINYDPLFPYGYGLTYQDHTQVEKVSEAVTVADEKNTQDMKPLFVRNLSDGVKWALSDSKNKIALMASSSGVSPDGSSLTMQSVNLAYQEDGRKFSWKKAALGSAILTYSEAYQAEDVFAGRYLNMKIRLDDWQSSSPITLQVQCSDSTCQNTVAIDKDESVLLAGQWVGISVAADCLDTESSDNATDSALRIIGKGELSLAVAEIALAKNPATNYRVMSCQ
ncbi:glycoside hydrolase family 3 protein [Alteromonas sp. BL110]|uniref:glycoside hydrolase family 3 protein n=1 Tax=Alteromonas sp. BL110 TaxID=1714845 RepID=UPI000E489725|nr:glycoside hydrolase family 3 N-terminal domain-containing protein [Alteromonas sp. BL110]AXT39528.1 glycoside hydrolase family 3 protein [Alteromonas sp. BL110]RKM81986.1 glycoside hydrolase family 3 protein [Alteromonas sp. BL110]